MNPLPVRQRLESVNDLRTDVLSYSSSDAAEKGIKAGTDTKWAKEPRLLVETVDA
jgi:hypothetical protein